jgi:hypothetical protein
MSLKKVLVIFDRENKLYFAGFSNGKPTWAQGIEAAHPYYHQDEADEDYESLKEQGFDVMVEG